MRNACSAVVTAVLTLAGALALALVTALPGAHANAAAEPAVESKDANTAKPEATRRAYSSSTAAAQLIDAIETSRLVVVGRIGQVRKIDAHGYAAKIWAEGGLGVGAEELEAGTSFQIAWEELSSGRPVRFAENDRVLACLELLPTASLWRTRFPDPNDRRQTQGVALRGEAWVRNPSPGSLDVLTHYLALPPTDRRGQAGVAPMLSLLVSGEPPLALSAAARLAGIEGLDRLLSKRDADQLVNALLRKDAGRDASDALSKLIAHRGGEAILLALERRRSSANAPLPPRFYDALGALAGELPKAEARALLESQEPALRAVAARHAAGPDARKILHELATKDEASEVRSAAIERLVALEGEGALPDALRALDDENALVRNTAARSVGALGRAGIAGLRSVLFAPKTSNEGADATTATARNAAIGGLGKAGPAGRRVLIEVARTHTDESIRRLATMALGYSHDLHH